MADINDKLPKNVNPKSYSSRSRWTREDSLWKDYSEKAADWVQENAYTSDELYDWYSNNPDASKIMMDLFNTKHGANFASVEEFEAKYFDNSPVVVSLNKKEENQANLKKTIRQNWNPAFEQHLIELEKELEDTNSSIQDYLWYMKNTSGYVSKSFKDAKAKQYKEFDQLNEKKKAIEKQLSLYKEAKIDRIHSDQYQDIEPEKFNSSFDRFIEVEFKRDPEKARYEREKYITWNAKLETLKAELATKGEYDADKPTIERNITEAERILAGMDANAVQWESKMKLIAIENERGDNYEKQIKPIVDNEVRLVEYDKILKAYKNEIDKIDVKENTGILTEDDLYRRNELVDKYNSVYEKYKPLFDIYDEQIKSPAYEKILKLNEKIDDLNSFQEREFLRLAVAYPKANAFDIIAKQQQLKADKDWEEGKWYKNQFTTGLLNVYKTIASTPNEFITAGRTIGMLVPGYSVWDYWADQADQNMKMTELATFVKPSKYTQSVVTSRQAPVTYKEANYLLDYDNDGDIINVRKENENVVYDDELKKEIISHFNSLPADQRPVPDGTDIKWDLMTAGVMEQLAIMGKFVTFGKLTSGIKALGSTGYLVGAGAFSYAVEYNNTFNEVYEQTGDARLANNIASASSTIMAALEAVEPNRMLWDTNHIFRKNFVKNLIGKGTAKTTIRNAFETGAKEVLGENIQEFLQNASPDVVKLLADRMFNVDNLEYDLFDKDEVLSTIALTTLTTGIMNTASSAYNIASQPESTMQQIAMNSYLTGDIKNPLEVINKQYQANRITANERDQAVKTIEFLDKFVTENYRPTANPADGSKLSESEKMNKSDMVVPALLALKAKAMEDYSKVGPIETRVQSKSRAAQLSMASRIALAKLSIKKQNPDKRAKYRILDNVYDDKDLFLAEYEKLIKRSTNLDFEIVYDDEMKTKTSEIREKQIQENRDKAETGTIAQEDETLRGSAILAKEEAEADKRIKQRSAVVRHSDNKNRGSLIYSGRKTGKTTWVKGSKENQVERHSDIVDVDDLIKEVMDENEITYTEGEHSQAFEDGKLIDRIDAKNNPFNLLDALYQKIEDNLAKGKDVIGSQQFLLESKTEYRPIDLMITDESIESFTQRNADLRPDEIEAKWSKEQDAANKIGKRKVVRIKPGNYIAQYMQARMDRFARKEAERIEKARLARAKKLTTKHRGLNNVKDAIQEIFKNTNRNELKTLAELMLGNKFLDRLTYLEQKIEAFKGVESTGQFHRRVERNEAGNVVKVYSGVRIDRSKMDTVEDLYETHLHEEIHRYIDHILRAFDPDSQYDIELNDAEKAFANEFIKLYRIYRDNGGKVSIEEFFTEGLTRPEEIQFLKGIKVDETNVFKKLISIVLDFLGWNQGTTLYDSMFKAFENYYKKVSEDADSMAYNDVWQIDARMANNAEFLIKYGLKDVNGKRTLVDAEVSVTDVDALSRNAANLPGSSLQRDVSDATIQRLIESGMITYTNENEQICGKEGVRLDFTPGTSWQVVTDLNGFPSHEEGGVDLNITKEGVMFIGEGGAQIMAANGLVVGGPKKKPYEEPTDEMKKIFEQVREEYRTQLNDPTYRQRYIAGIYGDIQPQDEKEAAFRNEAVNKAMLEKQKYVDQAVLKINAGMGVNDIQGDYVIGNTIRIDPIDYTKIKKNQEIKNYRKEWMNLPQYNNDEITDILRHEFSHNMDYDLQFMNIDEFDKNDIRKYDSDYKLLEGRPAHLTDRINSILSKRSKFLEKKLGDQLDYYTNPAEISARINTLRLKAKEQGYDYNQEFKVEDYFPVDENLKRDSELYDLRHILKLSDKEINELAKLVAFNDTENNESRS